MSKVLDLQQKAPALEISQGLAGKSKADQEEIFEIAREFFTPAELSLLFGWEVIEEK